MVWSSDQPSLALGKRAPARISWWTPTEASPHEEGGLGGCRTFDSLIS